MSGILNGGCRFFLCNHLRIRSICCTFVKTFKHQAMKIGDIQHVTHNHGQSGEPLAKPYYRLLTELKELEPFQRKFFQHQKSIPHWKAFKTREEAEQYAKENL